MTLHRLVHHLRTYRKVFGLSQDEVANLLGSGDGSNISRYEHFQATPSLRTAIAYEVIFHAHLPELFPGLYASVRAAVGRRAKRLANRRPAGRSKDNEAKRAFFESLSESEDGNSKV